tara:strand:+ start:303 stop:452 length:150 start_codon:yes stop_codon:yes gene_type:complete
MNTKTYITICYLTGYVIAPALSILMVMGAMEYIRSDVPTTNGVLVDGTT